MQSTKEKESRPKTETQSRKHSKKTTTTLDICILRRLIKATAECKFFIVMLLFSFLQGFAQFYLNILSENY